MQISKQVPFVLRYRSMDGTVRPSISQGERIRENLVKLFRDRPLGVSNTNIAPFTGRRYGGNHVFGVLRSSNPGQSLGNVRKCLHGAPSPVRTRTSRYQSFGQPIYGSFSFRVVQIGCFHMKYCFVFVHHRVPETKGGAIHKRRPFEYRFYLIAFRPIRS